MQIGTAVCGQGERQKGYLKVAELAFGCDVRLPVIIVRGVEDGPTLWVNGGVHGEEVSGIFAIQKLVNSIDPQELKGTLVVTPVSNPLAIKGIQKFTPEDQLDMNQQFPGREKGWLSEQMAYYLFKEVKTYADYLVDLHGLGVSYDSVPYTVYKNMAGVPDKINKKTEELTLLMGVKANCRVDLATAKGEFPGAIAGAIDAQCLLNGIPAFMFELGGKVDWQIIDFAVGSIRNMMFHLGMISGEVKRATEQIIITERDFVNSSHAGLTIPEIESGKIIPANTTLNKIVNFIGEELETLSLPVDAYILGIRTNPVVNSGEILVGVGTKWDQVN